MLGSSIWKSEKSKIRFRLLRAQTRVTLDLDFVCDDSEHHLRVVACIRNDLVSSATAHLNIVEEYTSILSHPETVHSFTSSLQNRCIKTAFTVMH